MIREHNFLSNSKFAPQQICFEIHQEKKIPGHGKENFTYHNNELTKICHCI